MEYLTLIIITLSACCGLSLGVKYIYATEGEDIHLCCFQDIPFNYVTWFGPPANYVFAVGNDVSRKVSSFIAIEKCTNGGSKLVIKNFSMEREGLYACYDSFRNQIFQIFSQKNPTDMRIVNASSDGQIIGYEGEKLTLVCTASQGQPGGNITWSTNSEILSIGGPEKVSFYLIPDRHDNGNIYTCTAFTSGGIKCLKYSVTLVVYYIPKVTITAIPSRDVVEGQGLRLLCEHDSNDFNLKFVWRKNRRTMDKHKDKLAFDSVNRNDTAEYQCEVFTKGGNGTEEISVSVNYAPNVTIQSINYDDNSYKLRCDPFGIPKTYTFYGWDHLSLIGQFIERLEGNLEAIKVDLIDEFDSYRKSGIYKCYVSNGIPNSDDVLIQTATHTLRLEGKPIFLPSTKTKQYGIYGHNVTLDFDLYCYPICINVSIRLKQKFDDLHWNASHGHYKLTKSFAVVQDSIYGSIVDVNATKITITVLNVGEADFDIFTVEIRNVIGSATINVVLLPKITESTFLFPQHTHVLILIFIIVLLLVILGGVSYKGIRAIPCNSIRIQRTEPNPQNESEELRQYDEIDIPVFSSPNEITTPHMIKHSESDIELPTTSPEFIGVANDNQVESGMCLSEVDAIFKRRPSSLSTNSIDISYLSPCGQYTELKQIRRINNGVHNYEKIAHVRNDFEPNSATNSDDIHQCQPHVKRWTI